MVLDKVSEVCSSMRGKLFEREREKGKKMWGQSGGGSQGIQLY